jgi:hypothetical protein
MFVYKLHYPRAIPSVLEILLVMKKIDSALRVTAQSDI